MAALGAVHVVVACAWMFAWNIHCENSKKSFGDMCIGTCVVWVAWEPMMVVLAIAGFVIFIKRLIKEVEDA